VAELACSAGRGGPRAHANSLKIFFFQRDSVPSCFVNFYFWGTQQRSFGSPVYSKSIKSEDLSRGGTSTPLCWFLQGDGSNIWIRLCCLQFQCLRSITSFDRACKSASVTNHDEGKFLQLRVDFDSTTIQLPFYCIRPHYDHSTTYVTTARRYKNAIININNNNITFIYSFLQESSSNGRSPAAIYRPTCVYGGGGGGCHTEV